MTIWPTASRPRNLAGEPSHLGAAPVMPSHSLRVLFLARPWSSSLPVLVVILAPTISTSTCPAEASACLTVANGSLAVSPAPSTAVSAPAASATPFRPLSSPAASGASTGSRTPTIRSSPSSRFNARPSSPHAPAASETTTRNSRLLLLPLVEAATPLLQQLPPLLAAAPDVLRLCTLSVAARDFLVAPIAHPG
ncbi:hypothetical protein SMACR_08680 [Sordaria macrospora]|uniref:Uncharacterized protein n=1 Tax=Sordaria macrospora TaxID=5147 RepID=A0A8S8ZL16_SORMA|nr:hypothetical protein SMACR_08680 [Sordaria macrospora]